jgi:hypothetical protein
MGVLSQLPGFIPIDEAATRQQRFSDNVFATGYDAAGERVPVPLSTIRTGDRLELCGKLYDPW